jgi:hypothetical protein
MLLILSLSKDEAAPSSNSWFDRLTMRLIDRECGDMDIRAAALMMTGLVVRP